MGLTGELDGILVVSLEQAVAAPYCGLLLADAGARVIKVERPEGDFARRYDKGAGGESVVFAWLNRGKESLCLDLNDGEDAELLRRLLQRADVFLHNLAPGSLERRGFGGPALREANPGLITCQITGYGRTGPAAQKKAYDFLVQAESGVCSVTGTEDQPARVGISIADIGSGLTAFSAILRALIQRGRTGVGVDLAISMFQVLADWMNMPLLAERYLDCKPLRTGLTHTLLAPYGAYRTGDGGQVLISIQNDREWRVFCREILQRPELGEDPRFLDNSSRVANRKVMDGYVDPVFAARAAPEMLAELETARIACAALTSVADLSEHPLLRPLTAQIGGAEVQLADLPVEVKGTRPAEAPLLDQHGPAIREEFKA